MGSCQTTVRFLIVLLTQLSLLKAFTASDLNRIRQFAEKGEPESQYRLGRIYDEGELVPKDPCRAVQWFRKAAEQGYAPAEWMLGACYNDGAGVERNVEEAVRWTTKSAEHGCAPAQFRLGQRYSEGKGVAKDPKEALKWWRFAAEQGNADAENAMGVMYDTGTVVEENKQTAFDWFLKGARHGSSEAKFNVALFYQSETGVKKDPEKAAYWYRQAAEAGVTVAQNNLGVMYRDGLGVPKDPITAFKWFTIAAREGMKEADQNRKPLFKTMDGKQIAAAIKQANDFVVPPPPVPDSDGVISGKSDAAIQRLLHGGHLFRLSTQGPSAAREYEFKVTIGCAKEDNCTLTPTVFHFIARPGDLVVVTETTNGLPYAFARNGFCVMLDLARPGKFQFCDNSSVKLRLTADKEIHFDLWPAIDEKGRAVPDVEFDLHRVLEYAFLNGKETHFDEQTHEIELTLKNGSNLRLQPSPDGHETKLGITSLTLEREVKTHFSDFVLENIHRPDLLKLQFEDFAPVQITARKFFPIELAREGAFMVPKDFFNNPAAKQAAERLKAILDHQPPPQ